MRYIYIVYCYCLLSSVWAKDDTLKTEVNLHEIEILHIRQKDTAHCKAHATVLTEDLLSRTPEIQMIRRGAFAMDAGIRGFTGGQIQVSLEGMRLHGACTDRMDPVTSYVEPINLESVNLETMQMANKYGAALGGSILLGLKKPIIDEGKPISAQYTLGYGHNAYAWSHMGAINFSTKKSALRISGAHRQAQNFKAGGDYEVLFSPYEKYNFLISAKSLLNLSTYIQTDILVDEGKNIGYPALTMDVGLASSKLYTLEIGKMKDGILQNIKLKTYYQDVLHRMDDSKRPNVPIRMDMPGWSSTWGVFAENTLKTHSKHMLLIRPEIIRHFSKAEMTMYPKTGSPMYMLTWPDNIRWTYAIYGNHEAQLTHRWIWYSTARIEWIRTRIESEFGKNQLETLNQNGTNTRNHTPVHLGTGIKKNEDNWTWSGYIAYQQRAPSVTEMLGFYLYHAYDGFDLIGNIDLKTEKSWHSEQRIQYVKPKKYSVELTTYLDRVENYILGTRLANIYSPMTIGARGVRMFNHTGVAYLTGAETRMQCTITPIIRVSISSRYALGMYENGTPLPLIAPFRSIQNIQLGTPIRYIRFESEIGASQQHINKDYGEQATTAFYIFHIRGNYEIEIKKIRWFINSGIENLFDTYYREHLDWGGIPRPGRNIYINTGLYF